LEIIDETVAQKNCDRIGMFGNSCSYRWRDPAPGDFDSKRTAQDLHTALDKAGEKTPWVMVGHSLGGPHVMIFTSLYDKEVAGLVLVDASHPAQVERFRKVVGNAIEEEPLMLKTPPLLAEIGARIGIVRLMNLCSPLPKAPPIAAQSSCAYSPQTASSNLKASQSFKTTLATAG
jgi:pimeloyl-ACP methyl ester carboxylesterase